MKRLIFLASLLSIQLQIGLFAQQHGICHELPPIIVDDSLIGLTANRMTCPNYHLILAFKQSVPQNFRPVIEFAANEWSNLLQESGFHGCDFTVVVLMDPTLPTPILAQWQPTNSSSGELLSGILAIKSTINWFVDATPHDDSEFIGGNPPPTGYDLLTVMRHELGHAVGWTTSSRVSNLLSNRVFDSNRLNISFDATSNHSNDNIHAGNLMNPSIGVQTRRSISMYPEVAMVSKAYHYTVNNLRAAENLTTFFPNGAVYQPFGNMTAAFNSPSGTTLILFPSTFDISSPIIRDKPMIIMAPRGKTAIIK